jgi:hypothetical protein
MNNDNIEFNHLYVTLEPETLESITTSEFIAENFCTMSRDTVQADEESWTGIYLRGKHTYLELFAPNGAKELKEGFSGIGFNTQQAGQINLINERLKSLVAREIQPHLRIRQTEKGKVPWFYYLSITDSQREAFAPWLMEFHQDYLDYKGIKPSKTGDFSRAAYMKTLDTKENSLFDDILEVHLNLTSSEHQDLGLLLQAFGYQSSCFENITTYRSNGLTLQVSETVNPIYRIHKIVCLLTTQLDEEKNYTFGNNAHLRVHQELAIWQFGSLNH